MTLTLRAVSLNNAPLTQPITAHFDVQGGTIGRSNQNTLSLPDPERFISRQHAEIVAVGKDYLIRNIGTSNPIIVRNHMLAQGESMPLMHRDSVRIGGYLLEVLDHISEETSEAATVLRGRAGFEGPASAASWLTPTGVPKTGPGSPPPELPAEFGSGSFELSPDNPFANLVVPAEAETPARSKVVPETEHAVLPRDFDPFAPRRQAAAPSPTARPAEGDIGSLVPVARRSSIDDIIGSGSHDEHDPMESFLTDRPAGIPSIGKVDVMQDRVPEMRAAFEPPRVRPPRDETLQAAPVRQPMPQPQPQPQPQAQPQPQPQLRPERRPLAAAVPEAASAEPAAQAEALPTPMRPVTPAPVRAQADPPPPTTTHDAQALWDAFCRGADIQLDAEQAGKPETMAVAGTLLRLAVEGILQLMALRSTTRYELHAAVTMIRPRENNALKFSPDAQAALRALLQPPARGYLPGPTAMSDAMNDLVGHAMGTMAGTRAALDGVLGRFAPAELESKLEGKDMLSRLLPMNRRSQLWELYLQHYQGIRDEAQEDFQALFGKAFLVAYEQQLDRLEQQRAARES